MAYFTGIQGFGVPTSTQSAAVLTDAQTIFTVSGGPIHAMQLASYCVGVCDSTAATLRWVADGDAAGQTATNITGISASLASFVAGAVLYCPFVALSTAPAIATTGVAPASVGGVIIPPGIIVTTVASGPTTGTFQHFLRWQPLGSSCTVTPAF